MKKIVVLYIFSLVSVALANCQSLVAQGDSAYLRKEYHHAVKYYEDAIIKEGISPEIYYNLGNAYYKSNNLAKAVLNYERALRLKADYIYAIENLKFTRAKIGGNINLETSSTDTSFDFIINLYSANGWGWISLVLFIIAIILYGIYFMFNVISIKKIGFFGGGAVALLFMCTIICAIISTNRSLNTHSAIIMDDNTILSSQPHIPTNQSEDLGAIKCGAKVEIIDSISTPNDTLTNKWYNIKYNTKRAWVRSNCLEKI